ncbi:hypothetical protein [Paraburkholderia phytofirmans]|uniref:hypothetical protein n=1 Tax=Paraburkholderia phytofirmans TaxID=261302 RepID=UPI0038B7472D
MSPILAIVWIAVIVFACTAILTIAYISGYASKIPEKYGNRLFYILIVQIVGACVSAASYFLAPSHFDKPKENQIPIKDLMVAEKSDSPKIVHDNNKTIYIRSPDVSRARRVAELDFSTDPNFFKKVNVTLSAGISQVIKLEEENYRVGFSQVGIINGEKDTNYDVIFLTVSREK